MTSICSYVKPGNLIKIEFLLVYNQILIFRFFTFLCHSLPYFCHNSPLRHLIIHYKNFYVALKKFHLGVAKTLQILNKRWESKRIINFRGCRKGVARPSQGCRKGVAFSDKSRTFESGIILRRRKCHLRHLCDTP